MMNEQQLTETQVQRTAKVNGLKQSISLVTLWCLAVITTSAAIFIVMNDVHFTRVLSGSMAPEFHRGDTLMVKPVPRTELSLGQIAVLPSQDNDGTQFAHRIIFIKKSGLNVYVKTKGDANKVADPWMMRILSKKVPVVLSVIPTKSVPLVQVGRGTVFTLLGAMIFIAGTLVVRPVTKRGSLSENP